ncbi:MAG: hypothetical protein V1721_09880 [Pseudomonadota bacterium]
MRAAKTVKKEDDVVVPVSMSDDFNRKTARATERLILEVAADLLEDIKGVAKSRSLYLLGDVIPLPLQDPAKISKLKSYEKIQRLCKKWDLRVGIETHAVADPFANAAGKGADKKSKELTIGDLIDDPLAGKKPMLCLVLDPTKGYAASLEKLDSKNRHVVRARPPFDPMIA